MRAVSEGACRLERLRLKTDVQARARTDRYTMDSSSKVRSRFSRAVNTPVGCEAYDPFGHHVCISGVFTAVDPKRVAHEIQFTAVN